MTASLSPAPSSLLPAFVPSPSSSRSPSPSRNACTRPHSPLFNLATAAAPSLPPGASPPVHATRPRSRSFHQASAFSSRRSRSPPPPMPLPYSPPSPAYASTSKVATPPSPRTLAEAAGSLVLAVSGLGLDTHSPSSSGQAPRIRKVTVPHSTKVDGATLFACRVVPFAIDPSPPATASASTTSSAPMSRQASREPSLGPMSIAGHTATASEPYTVYRSWVECSTLSIALNNAFAGMPGLPKLTPGARGLGFMKAGGVSDVQREAVLDKFMCRLFGMPQGVRDCEMVRDFFAARKGDVGEVEVAREVEAGSPASMVSPGGSWGEVRGASEEGGISFGDFLSKIDTSGAAISPVSPQRPLVFPSPTSATSTPAPSIRAKASSASLRTQRYDSLPRHQQVHDSPDSFVRPLILGRAATAADVTAPARSSRHSSRTSASSSSSVTAVPHASEPASRSNTPLARAPHTTASARSSFSSQHRPPPLALARADPGKASPLGLPELAVAAAGTPKKPKLLRAVRSLGDIRKIKDLVAPVPVPALPIPPATFTASDLINAGAGVDKTASPKAIASPGPSPKPFGFAMLRQLSGPLSPAGGVGMTRGASKQSSQSNATAADGDDEELWGTSTEYFPPQPVSAGFREAPNGRLESLSRRPSISRAANSAPRAYYHHHKSSLSGSSLASMRSGLSSVDLGRSVSDRGGYFSSSARTSADFSISDRSSVGHAPSTPPTPGSEFGAPGGAGGVSMGRYREVDGKLVTNQSFALQQPFYALPPPMAVSKSCDSPAVSPTLSTGVRSHTRKSSLEHPHRRARVSSSASLASMQLGTILASPQQASFSPAQLHPAPAGYGSAPSTPGAGACRDFIEFKLKHPKETFRKRFATAGLDYAALRQHVLDAFAGSEARLEEAEGGWGLLCNEAGRTWLVDGQGAFEEMMRREGAKGKVVLSVLSA